MRRFHVPTTLRSRRIVSFGSTAELHARHICWSYRRPSRLITSAIRADSDVSPTRLYSAARQYPCRRRFGSDRFQRQGFSSSTDLTNASEKMIVGEDGVQGRPIDFDVQSKIEGNESQIVTITLEPGQVLRAESGGKSE